MSPPLPAKLPTNLLAAASESVPELSVESHRILAKLIANGVSPEDCAEAVGLSNRQIVAILNWSPTFRQELGSILQSQKSLDPRLLLRSFLVPALLTCYGVMNSDKASAADKLNAAREILNRTLGKPSESKSDKTSDPMAKLLEIERETQKLQSLRQ